MRALRAVFLGVVAMGTRWDSEMVKDGAMVQVSCETPTSASVDTFRAAVWRHLSPGDVRRFENATGVGVRQLLEDQAWDGMDRSTLVAIMGTEKLTYHPLNRLGLHALRALLAERMTESRRGRSAKDGLAGRLAREGYVVVPLAEPESMASALRALRAVSGYRHLGASKFSRRFEGVTYDPEDPQLYMHVDTFLPSWKVWLFERTTAEQGPFHFVVGSHRNSWGKLRWLFERTRDRVRSVEAAGTTTTKTNEGPWRDASHGWQKSIRVEGFDWRRPEDDALGPYGFPAARAVTIEEPSIVIADTSGFHYRGIVRGNRTRRAAKMKRSFMHFQGRAGESTACRDMGGDIPRKNPFYCEERPDAC